MSNHAGHIFNAFVLVFCISALTFVLLMYYSRRMLYWDAFIAMFAIFILLIIFEPYRYFMRGESHEQR